MFSSIQYTAPNLAWLGSHLACGLPHCICQLESVDVRLLVELGGASDGGPNVVWQLRDPEAVNDPGAAGAADQLRLADQLDQLVAELRWLGRHLSMVHPGDEILIFGSKRIDDESLDLSIWFGVVSLGLVPRQAQERRTSLPDIGGKRLGEGHTF